MESWMYILLFSPVVPYAAPAPYPPVEYYVGVVAAEAAYATLPTGVPVPPPPPAPAPVDPKNCPTCKGTGRVPTGDSNNPWTKCPTCQPSAAPAELPRAKVTLPPGPFPKPQHSTATPPASKATVAPPAPCANGTCPVEKAAPAAPLSGVPLIPVPMSPRRIFRRR